MFPRRVFMLLDVVTTDFVALLIRFGASQETSLEAYLVRFRSASDADDFVKNLTS